MNRIVAYNLIIINPIFIGSYLGGLFRACFPLFKKGSVALGEELLKSGVGIVSDIAKTGDLKAAQNKRGKEFINNVSTRISDHMFGSGYNPTFNTQLKQLKRRVTRRKTRGRVTKKKVVPKKKKKVVKRKPARKNKKKAASRSKLDIFS